MRLLSDGLLHNRFFVQQTILSVSSFLLAYVGSLGLTWIWFSLLWTGCSPSPMLKYDRETPPTALVPIGYAGISDERARFREIFCAIQQDHGSRFPDDRPCDQALHRLAGEPVPQGRPVYLGHARLPLRFVILPGLLGDCLAAFIRPFSDARPHLESLGFKTDCIMVSGLGGSAQNASQIREAVAMPFNREHPMLANALITCNSFPREVLLEAVARFVEESLLAGR